MKHTIRILAALLIGALALTLGLSVALAQGGDGTTDLPPLAAGDVILLQGQVLNVDGSPVEGAVVEIWQTDANGNYNHPNDAPASALDDTFQYFGTATTDADGYYAFRTIVPGEYEPRPQHIHVKVKVDGEEALTTQFYFEENRDAVESDGVFQASADAESLFLVESASTDDAGETTRIATGDLVIALAGSTGDLELTPAQVEGPYYPVVDFSGYDNDLTSVAEDNEPVLPILEAPAEFTLLNLNTASAGDFLTVPDVGNRMVREFMEYRPYVSIAQFRREIGKYVDQAQVAAYEAYVYVPISVDSSDAATLMQIPGLDQDAADALIAARPFGSNDAFLEALSAYLSDTQASYAANYLGAE